MSYAEGILAVIMSILASCGLSYAVHRRVHVDTRRRHQDVGIAIFLQLGVLFAVLLAFVFSEAYSEYGEAQQAIDLECGALHATAMLASTLPAAEARDMLGIEARYIQAVVEHDWPEMRRHRHGSAVAVVSLMDLVRHAGRLPVAGPADLPVKAQLLELLSTAHAQREVRLFQAGNGLPVVLWTVLIGFSFVLMIFVAYSGVERFLWLAMFGMTFSICVSAILVLVRLLDYPFEGAIALSPEDFLARLHDVAGLLQSL